MAELVDALDSGSSGQYACGGSSPPFRSPLIKRVPTNRWLNFLLLILFVLANAGATGCSPRGEEEVSEVRKHVAAMSKILEAHQEEPRRALEELERYEAEHRAALTDLNHRVRDLRPQLTSSEKRELSTQWKLEIAELEKKLETLNTAKEAD